MSKIKVLIVEDEPLIAEDIKDLLSNYNYVVVGVAYTKDEALSILQSSKPDIALLDINLGGNTDGIVIAEIINEKYKIPFVYLTSYSSKVILDQVKHTHPMGYVVKPFEDANVFAAIEIALSNFASLKKNSSLCIDSINKNLSINLTQKEYEILEGIYNGYSNLEIADKNFVSINTIKTHIQKVYEKLDSHSRAEAIVKIRKLLNV